MQQHTSVTTHLMTDRKKHKRLYYIPGILTLALLPIYFTTQINNYLDSRKQYAIEVLRLNDTVNSFNIWPELPKTPAVRKYLIFEIEENSRIDSLKFLLIENILCGIEKSKDTTIGVKILFNDSLKYRTVIEAINTCLKSNINTFLIHSDTLISYHRAYTYYDDTLSKYPTFNYVKFPLLLSNDIIFIEPETHMTFYDRIIQNKKIIKISSLYLLWFLIIAYLNIKKLIKINEW